MTTGWESPPTPVYVGDRWGNPRTIWVGFAKVIRQTKIGMRLADEGVPDYTMDAAATGDLVAVLQDHLQDLVQLGGRP
jgi:hypothetical protein